VGGDITFLKKSKQKSHLMFVQLSWIISTFNFSLFGVNDASVQDFIDNIESVKH
jgi:hypothetical protein